MAIKTEKLIVNGKEVTIKHMGAITADQNKSKEVVEVVKVEEVEEVDSPIEFRVAEVIKKDLQRGRLKRGWYLQILLHEDGDLFARRTKKDEKIEAIFEGKTITLDYNELLNCIDTESSLCVPTTGGWTIIDTHQ